MVAVAAVPAAVAATTSRNGSMTYADLYGAADDTGPSSAVAGTVGYVNAQELAAGAVSSLLAPSAQGLVGYLHELIDTPTGLAFLVAGGVLLFVWHDLT
jgi:hypothetical protein